MKLLVINCHYVTPEIYKRGIYPVTPNYVDSKIKKLLGKGWKPISPNDLKNIEVLKEKKGENLFLFTFDDGLKCQYTYAYPVLKSHGIKAIFFIPTIIFGKALTVHKIQCIRYKIDDPILLDLLFKKFPEMEAVPTNDNNLKEQYPYDSPQAARLKFLLNFVLREDKKEYFIDDIFSQIEDIERFFCYTYMDVESIRYLAEKECVGSHGHNHQPLSRLSSRDLRNDIRNSIYLLKSKAKIKDISMISYPYGSREAVSINVKCQVKSLNFSYGFTMNRGVNTINNLIEDPYALKRIQINDLDNWI